MRDRVARKRVGTALKQDELGLPLLDIALDFAPRSLKRGIVGAGRQRDIELGADGNAAARLLARARAGIEKPAVLVQVGEGELGILLEGIEHTVAVVRIDVDVGDAHDAVVPPRGLDGDTAIVEYAKARGRVAPRMMQSADRNESARNATRDDAVERLERTADDRASRLENPRKCGRVAVVEPARPHRRELHDAIDIARRVEHFELRSRRRARRDELKLAKRGRSLELASKRIMAIRTERVPGRKSISGNFGSGYENGVVGHKVQPAVFIGRRFTDNPPPARPLSTMAQYIYTTNRLAKVVPPKRYILRDISLSFFPGAKIGVLGLNGSGKSTLLRIMAGVDKDFEGEARAQPGINIGYLPQEPELDASKTVRGIVEEAVAGVLDLIARFNAISERFAEPLDDDEMNGLLEEQGKLQDQIDAAGGWALERKLEIAADALRLPPWEARVESLSGGERRRVALCRLLLSSPDMLLLDEPTNHLDAESVAWLERFLAEFAGTVVGVTHDRYFLDNVAGWILELDRGYGIPWQGNYSSWLEQKAQRLALEEKQEAARQRAIKTELEWVRTNPKARQAKAKARLQRFDELNSKEFQARNETNEIYIPPGPRLGDLVIDVQGLGKSYGDRLLFENLSFSLPPGGIVGVIGPNGAGKTTLFRILLGREKPSAGSVKVGSSVELAYVDQSRDTLDASKTVWEEISDGQDILRVGSYETSSRGYVGRFNFRGADQQKQVGLLSGGERNRVHLAKVLRAGGNVLFLDEPTNDLDVETLRALEEALLNFPGCAVVISHDRWFLDRIATHILAFEGLSEVVYFQGNYADYAADLKRRKGEDADQPHRLRYKRL